MLDQQKITILYCRLSNEDAQEGESNSIANQREYLTRYARDHGYTNLKILVDDGYTGTNFNRPGVQEGFELVKKVFLTSSQTRTAELGSRLKRLHPAARIICALFAHKFHTCRA